MAFLEQRLVIKPTQKMVLTPRLAQMVSLLVLNKLELQDMITAELVENPVLEEATDIVEMDEEKTDQQSADSESEVSEPDC